MDSGHEGHRSRLRKRFLINGLTDFAPHEALELLLYYAIPRRDVNPLAHRLLRQFGSLSAVLDASMEELQTVEGLGENAALFLSFLPRLYAMVQEERGGIHLTTPAEIGAFFVNRFYGECHEVVRLLCVNGKGDYLSCRTLGEGGIRSATVHVRKAAEAVLSAGAVTAYLAHNHPSGNTQPSREDYDATLHLRSVLKPLGVELRDHYIVWGREYLSMREGGFLDAVPDW